MPVLTDLMILIPLILGIALLVLEIFLPGFGAAGICGLVLEGVSIYFTATRHGSKAALILAAVVLVITGLAIFLSLRSAAKGRLSKTALVLNETETPAAEEPMTVQAGDEGTALTALRPSGTALFGEQRLDVMTEGDFVEPGQAVRVLRTDGRKITVRKV